MTTTGHEVPGVPVDGSERRIPGFNVSFMDPEAMDRLREAQHDPVFEAGRQAVQALSLEEIAERGDDARDEARSEAVSSSVDEHLNTHVPRSWLGEVPELHDRFAAIVGRYSYHNMSEQEWQSGLPAELADTDTNKQRPGRDRLQEELDALMVEYGRPEADENDDDPDDDPEPDPDAPPNLETVRTLGINLTNARNKLAELSIQRRQLIRKNGAKAKDLAAQYDAATIQYNQANMAYSTALARRWRAGVNNRDEIVAAPNDATLHGLVVRNLLEEHQLFSQAEYDALEADGSTRARFANWLVKKRLFTPANIATGVALGFGAKWALRGLVGVATGIAAPASLGAIGAAKTTRAAFAASIGNRVDTRRHFEDRHTQDHNELATHLNEATRNVGGSDDDTLIGNVHGHLQGVIDRRVEKDRKRNRNRVFAAAAIGGAAGAVGEMLEFGLEHYHVIGGLDVHSPHAPGSGGHGGNGSGGNGGSGHGGGNGHNGNSGNGNNPGGNTPGGHKPGYIDGYNTNVHIGSGEGYEQALGDLAHQKGIHMTETQNWALYQHLNGVFHGNFLTNDPSYHMDNPGQWGISSPGGAHWSPAVINEMNSWLNQHNIHAQAVKKTAKAAKAAGRAARNAYATAA